MDETPSNRDRNRLSTLPPASSLAAVDRHTLAVDIVLFTIQNEALQVLLVKRRSEPFQGSWSLPGGIVSQSESVDEAALRELQAETGISRVYLEQLYTFGDLDRDPRGRVITVSYYAVVDWGRAPETVRVTPAEATWFPAGRLPSLAFDHKKIIAAAIERLRSKVNYTTVAFQLLPKAFALSELQRAYEVILGKPLDKRNFRKKMLQLGVLKDTGARKTEGRQRPARLYSFTEARVIKLQEKGILVPF